MQNNHVVNLLNQKIWLVGMFRGQREILEQTVLPCMPYVDGLVAVLDSRAKKEDIEWLESIKGQGEIIVKKWVNDHAWTMNHFLFTDKIKWPDYCMILDETDKPNHLFIKDFRVSSHYWHQNNVGCLWIDHPFIFRYHPGVRIIQSPHWSISGIIGKNIDLKVINGYKKECFIDNLRKNDILRSAFISPIKYFIEYPPFSNHTELLYRQFGDEIWRRHELLRIEFQFLLIQELGIQLTVEDFKDYLIKNNGSYPKRLEDMIEIEVNLKDAFRLFVLNEPWINLHNNRFDWSYYRWKQTGEIIQAKTGNGIFNEYKKAKGEKPE